MTYIEGIVCKTLDYQLHIKQNPHWNRIETVETDTSTCIYKQRHMRTHAAPIFVHYIYTSIQSMDMCICICTIYTTSESIYIYATYIYYICTVMHIHTHSIYIYNIYAHACIHTIQIYTISIYIHICAIHIYRYVSIQTEVSASVMCRGLFMCTNTFIYAV